MYVHTTFDFFVRTPHTHFFSFFFTTLRQCLIFWSVLHMYCDSLARASRVIQTFFKFELMLEFRVFNFQIRLTFGPF